MKTMRATLTDQSGAAWKKLMPQEDRDDGENIGADRLIG